MNKLVVSLVILVGNFVSSGVFVCNAKNVVVTSPDGAVTVTVGVKDQHAFYMVNYQNRPLVSPSRLGFLLDDKEVGAHVKMGHVSRDTKDETWSQPWGEDETVHNHYNELTVSFLEKTGAACEWCSAYSTTGLVSDIYCQMTTEVKRIVFRRN